MSPFPSYGRTMPITPPLASAATGPHPSYGRTMPITPPLASAATGPQVNRLARVRFRRRSRADFGNKSSRLFKTSGLLAGI
jgi:hypothetical protein